MSVIVCEWVSVSVFILMPPFWRCSPTIPIHWSISAWIPVTRHFQRNRTADHRMIVFNMKIVILMMLLFMCLPKGLSIYFFSTKTAFFQRDKLFLFIKLLKNIPKKRIVKFQLCVRLIAMLNETKKIYSKVDLTSENIRKRDNQFNWMTWLNITPLLWVTSMPENAECSKLIWIKP